jgi:hypothetical protein
LAEDEARDPVEAEQDVERAAGRTAPEDPILAERLGAPAEARELYLEEASPYRPVATGDIFQGVPVPGSDPEEAAYGLSMVLAHPSAMRKGALLEPRVRAAPLAPVDGLSRKKWARGHFNVFPLPVLAPVARENGFELDDRGWGVLLELAAPVSSAELDVRNRVACLSPIGIQLLLQRLVHADTRYPVREELLAEVFAPKLEEFEMLENWNEELVAPSVDASSSNLQGRLIRGAVEFEEALQTLKAGDGTTVRSMLDSGTRASEARRILAAEIRRRRASS